MAAAEEPEEGVPPASAADWMGGWEATEVASGIWVGDLASALNRDALVRHAIDGIVCLVPGVHHDEQLCRCLHVPVRDCPEANIVRSFPAVLEFCCGKSNVLFHCSVGRSRSATAALLVLLQRHPSVTVSEMLRKVQAKRPIIQPNSGFLAQLEAWQRQQTPSSPASSPVAPVRELESELPELVPELPELVPELPELVPELPELEPELKPQPQLRPHPQPKPERGESLRQ
jgi:hypothetical protein